MRYPKFSSPAEVKSTENSRRLIEDALRNTEALSIARICAGTCLPKDSAPEDTALRTIELVFTVNALLQDQGAMEFLYKLACSATSRRTRGRPPSDSAGHLLWQEFIGNRPASNGPEEKNRSTKKRSASQTPRDNNLSESSFLTHQDLARRWKVSTMTLRRWRRAGKLTSHYLGRCVRFKLADVIALEEGSAAAC